MFGILFGIGCLIGLWCVVRGGRRGWRGRRGFRGRHRRRWSGWGRGWMHWLYDELDATPGQEKVIKGELDGLREQLHGLQREVKKSGDDVARAVGGEQLDETILGEVFARHDDALRDVRKAVVGSLARIHEALDPEQRERLAKMLSRSRGFGGGGGGPYRDWA